MHPNAKLPDERMSEVVQFSTTRSVRDRLEEVARAQRRPLSAILREAASAWLKENGNGFGS